MRTIDPSRNDEKRGHHSAYDEESEGRSPLLNTEISGLVKEEKHDGLDDRYEVVEKGDVLEHGILVQAYSQHLRLGYGLSGTRPRRVANRGRIDRRRRQNMPTPVGVVRDSGRD